METFLRSKPVLQVVKKFPAFYGTRSFITAFTSARQLSLSGVSSIQSIPPHPTSWRPILILFSHLHLGLPCGLFPSGFPTKTLYTPLPFPKRATCPAHLILLDFITRTILILILGEEYQSYIQVVSKRALQLWKRIEIYTEDIRNVLNCQNVAKHTEFYLG